MNRRDLLNALKHVQSIAEKRRTMPMHSSMILVEARPGRLDISATNSDISLRLTCHSSITETGSIAVSAPTLYKIVQSLHEGEINLTLQDKDLAIIRAGASESKLMLMPVSEFPALPAAEPIELMPLPGAKLADLIGKTLFAVAKNDTRHTLNGLSFAITTSGEQTVCRMVGSDGCRMAVAEQVMTIPNGKNGEKNGELNVIIPKKTARILLDLLKEGGSDPLLGFVKNLLYCRKGSLLLTSKLIEGTYPNYKQVMPKENNMEQCVVVNRKELTTALHYMIALSENATRPVRITVGVNGHLTLLLTHPNAGEATENVAARYGGKPLTINFNPRYLLDILTVLDGEMVALQIDAPESPCLIREPENERARYLLMPMRS
jgi:DNA polymerase-3 subunit beta